VGASGWIKIDLPQRLKIGRQILQTPFESVRISDSSIERIGVGRKGLFDSMSKIHRWAGTVPDLSFYPDKSSRRQAPSNIQKNFLPPNVLICRGLSIQNRTLKPQYLVLACPIYYNMRT
jgi:hypothetical protein